MTVTLLTAAVPRGITVLLLQDVIAKPLTDDTMSLLADGAPSMLKVTLKHCTTSLHPIYQQYLASVLYIEPPQMTNEKSKFSLPVIQSIVSFWGLQHIADHPTILF